jgi:hypothetical protein
MVSNHISNLDDKLNDDFGDQIDMMNIKGEIKNPFYMGLNYEPIDIKNIYSTYNRILILCLKNETVEYNFDMKLFNNMITYQQLQDQNKYLTLINGNMKLLKNNDHHRKIIIIAKKYLKPFNDNLNLNETELILFMPDLNKKKLHNYIDLYAGSNNFNDISDNLSVLDYYTGLDNPYIKMKLSHKFQQSSDSDYWSNPYNCKINFTNEFVRRHFRKTHDVRNNRKIAALALSTKKLNSSNMFLVNSSKKIKNNINNINDHYEKILTLKKKYSDVSYSLSTKNNYKLYYVQKNIVNISNELVVNLLNNMKSNKLKFNFFNMILSSKKHCHLAINNESALKLMHPIISSAAPFYKYLFGYAWINMYLEECIVKTYATPNSRFVFNINTANKLPYFPNSTENLDDNPYLPVFIDSSKYNVSTNCMGITMTTDKHNHGFTTLDKFKKRFNIFSTGVVDKNILTGIDWDVFAIAGSSVLACAMNTVLTQLTKQNTDLETWNYFYNLNFEKSDIDMMCNEKSTFKFMDHVQKLINKVKENLCDISGKDVAASVHINTVRSLSITIHYDYLKNQFNEEKLQDIIKNIESNRIKEIFYGLYIKNKLAKNTFYRKEYNNNPLYEQFYNIINIDDMTLIITTDKLYNDTKSYDSMFIKMSAIDENIKPVNDYVGVCISELIRFQIKSPYLNHSLEIFRSRYANFFSTVQQFHFPCVRMYYDGKDVHILPSCVSALLSGININSKYIAGTRDPAELIRKYNNIGFGIILNNKEKKYYYDYFKDDQLVIPGFMTLDNTNFKRDQYHPQINVSYIKTKSDLYNFYKTKTQSKYDETKSDVKFLQLKTINCLGDIIPLKQWTFGAACDYFIY